MSTSVVPPLVLASASPRRARLLARAGVPCEVRPARIDEELRPGEDAAALVERLAGEKALAIAGLLAPSPPRWVLGADTVVVRDGAVLGKPVDRREAVAMLTSLVGREHTVLTGVVVVSAVTSARRSAVVESRVEMRAAARDEIEAYVATGEPMDKAGAYALQGEAGRRFVSQVKGSPSNVIGLPLDETLALLHAMGALAQRLPTPDVGW